MGRIRLKVLYENQDFRYIKIRDNEPYYGYSFTDCTLFNLIAEVHNLIKKLHSSYRFIIEVPHELKPNQRITYRYI